jgi:hypothetical protein
MYEPQVGDIGLTQIGGITGKLIRIGQWLNGDGFADYEHAFVYVGLGEVVEAQPGGAILAPLSKYDASRIVWHRAPEGKRYAVAHYAYGMLGTPYSFLDYFAIGAVRLRLPSKRLRAYVASTRHLICSQLADEAYRRAGVQLFSDGRQPGQVTPGALYKLFRKE